MVTREAEAVTDGGRILAPVQEPHHALKWPCAARPDIATRAAEDQARAVLLVSTSVGPRRETKSTLDESKRRPAENAKIKAATEHFKQLGIGSETTTGYAVSVPGNWSL